MLGIILIFSQVSIIYGIEIFFLVANMLFNGKVLAKSLQKVSQIEKVQAQDISG